MPLPGFLTKIFSGGAKDIIDSVGSVIDNLTTSKEEKEQLKIKLFEATNAHIQAMGEQANKELELQLKDTADARDREVKIATSENAPTLNKIIQPILSLVVVGVTLTIWALILFRNYEPKTNEAMIIGGLTAFTGNVLNYYFGSSSGSKQKSDQLDKLANK